jgi:formylglycine-generating enzyme required for sulfatase activity
MRGKLLKGTLVVVGAITISALGLLASDGLRGVNNNLVALTGAGGLCPDGMIATKREGNTLCVDRYEASTASACPHKDPKSIVETEANLSNANCFAESVPNATPWRFVSLPQAQRLCANAGKRLPKSSEWYQLALGTKPDACITDQGSPALTGTSDCISASGVYDMVGNMWEWVDEQVNGNTFDGRPLPGEGYVTAVDASGVAVTTADATDDLYGDDYFWSKTDGVFGMIRGGYYGSKSDAGLYAINVSIPTSFASPGIGFRCVKDL